MQNHSKGGYVGLLALLIGVAIMVFLMSHFYLSYFSPTATSTTSPSFQQGMNGIEQAKEARDVIELQSREAAQQ